MCGIHLIDLNFSIKIIYAKLLLYYTMYINYIQKHIVQIYVHMYHLSCIEIHYLNIEMNLCYNIHVEVVEHFLFSKKLILHV